MQGKDAVKGGTLADGSPDPDSSEKRALRGSHPDLSWVTPSGAHEMRIDDIAEPPGTLHVALGMSTRAHAEIASIDLDKVRAAPGVVAVFTGADLRDDWKAAMPCAWPVTEVSVRAKRSSATTVIPIGTAWLLMSLIQRSP